MSQSDRISLKISNGQTTNIRLILSQSDRESRENNNSPRKDTEYHWKLNELRVNYGKTRIIKKSRGNRSLPRKGTELHRNWDSEKIGLWGSKLDLKTTRLRVGLSFNFGTDKFEMIRRIFWSLVYSVKLRGESTMNRLRWSEGYSNFSV